MADKDLGCYYRFDDHRTCSWDREYDVVTGTYTTVAGLQIPVTKKTPKGVRLEYGPFVGDNFRKKYACSTPEDAFDSFVARKEKQIKILSNQLAQAKEALCLATTNKDWLIQQVATVPYIDVQSGTCRKTSYFNSLNINANEYNL